MIVVASKKALQDKYKANADSVLAAIAGLGALLDVSDMTPAQVRTAIDQRDPSPARAEAACLIGGYDIVPAFRQPNPTFDVIDEVDADVMSDAPYGARPGSPAEVFLPTRAVSRIPDSGTADAGQFIAILNQAAAAPGTDTPDGVLHLAAQEFAGAAQLVQAVPSMGAALKLSPPVAVGAPTIQSQASNMGRIHFLLHGADQPNRWDRLYGAADSEAPLRPAMRVSELKGCVLSGAIVSFSTCYSAMLDTRPGKPLRDPDNQPALACLVAGAKTVYGSTRANWIDDTAPFDSFGSALIAEVWRLLNQGVTVAEALRKARFSFAQSSLARDAWTRPYVLKTLLQAQCYGHPMARLH